MATGNYYNSLTVKRNFVKKTIALFSDCRKFLIHSNINSEVSWENGSLNLNIKAKLQDAVNALNYGSISAPDKKEEETCPYRIKRKLEKPLQ